MSSNEAPEPHGETEFAAEAMIAELARSRAEHAQVVAQRPTGGQLGDSLHRFAELLYETLNEKRESAIADLGLASLDTHAWFPRPNSVGAADIEANQKVVERFLAASPTDAHWLDTNPDRNPTSWGLGFVARAVYTVVDHLDAIARLISIEEHVRSPVTLARTALEAASTACFLLDPGTTSQERLRRTLNLQFEEAKEDSNGWESGSSERVECETLLEELIAFSRLAGLDVQRYRPGRHHPPVIGGDGESDATRQLVERVLPGFGLDAWRSMSAVAHSRRSTTLYLHEYALPHRSARWQRVESTAWHTVPVLIVVQELCKRLAEYLEWDLGDWNEAFELLCTQWAAGAGQFDEQIRRSLGL